MTIISCPHCGDKVTAPENVSSDAIVRCPLCTDEYPLAEALKGVPPMLILVSAGPSASAAASEIRLAPADSPAPSPSTKPFVFEERPAPRKLAARPRPVRREKNPLVEMLKIVAGGVVGLSIGQLILWWVPGLQLGQRDPLDLGPKVSRYVPWIVPTALRVPELDDDVELAQDPAASSAPSRQASSDRGTRSTKNRVVDDQPPADPFAEPPRGSQHPGQQRSDIAAANRSTTNSTAPKAQNNGGSENENKDEDENTREISGTASADSAAQVIGVRNAPLVSVAEISVALVTVQDVWEAESTSDKSEALESAIADLARCITFVDPGDEQAEGAAEAARSLLQEIARDQQTLNQLIATNQSSTLRQPFRGRIVVGSVESITTAGELFVTTIASDQQLRKIVSVVDPRESLDEKEEVLILGVDIPKPRAQLAGYLGGDTPVVFGGLVTRLPKSTTDESRQSSARASEQPAVDSAETTAEPDPTTNDSENPVEPTDESTTGEQKDEPPAATEDGEGASDEGASDESDRPPAPAAENTEEAEDQDRPPAPAAERD